MAEPAHTDGLERERIASVATSSSGGQAGRFHLSEIDLTRYHDLTSRLASFSSNGGTFLRGDREDLTVIDGEPALSSDETELVRIGGLVNVVGPRSTRASTAATLGLVCEGVGVVLVTSERLVLMLSSGASQLGKAGDGEVHAFVLPFDLVDAVSIPHKRSLRDRVAGGRAFLVYATIIGLGLKIEPAKRVEIRGRTEPMSDERIADLVIRAVVEHRIRHSPTSDRDRLLGVRDGQRTLEGGDSVARISGEEVDGIPPHLHGRLAEG